MVVSINQPAYVPWLGYFDRILHSDLHIVLDHVQFEKNSVVNRNKIRVPNGWAWISVPIFTKNRFGKLAINQLQIDSNSPWRKKHWGTLQANYSRCAHFKDHAPFFEDLYQKDWLLLAPLLEYITSYLLKEFGIETERVYSSEMLLGESKSDLILEICKRVGATTYLSGPFGRDYLQLESFDRAGIKVRFHEYTHPEYNQGFKGFEPFMSAIDLLFNHGGESLDILRS